MSKLQDICRSVGVYSDYGFFFNQPYIWYRPQGDSRSMDSSGWFVSKRGEDLSDHWTDHGSKFFLVWGRSDKQEKFEKASLYMYEKWGIEELDKSPFGGYGDEEYVKVRISEIKEKAKSGQREDGR